MKKSMLLVALFILTSVALKAQSPQKINFQSIVRNTNGVIVSNKSVSFKITILSGSTTGTPVYSETHLKTTDAIGLVSLQIGSGTVASGVFSSIGWGNAVHFIKLEADFTGGNTYVTLGTQELMSVPYAMYAAKTDTASLNLTNRFADKAPVNNPTFTGTVGGITKAMVVGLENVDNTSDVDKPVSTATQTALDTKFNKADFPRGNKPGEFLYWNGQNWQSFEPGSSGQTIIIDQSGNPTWGCITANSAAEPSSSPTLEVNTALTAFITIATTGAKGIDTTGSGLPNGVTATWSADVITISGTPTLAGTFNYSIHLSGGCGTVSATGTITVATVPGDVEDVVVTDGLEEGEVIVTFSPPLSDGGSPIIEYEVEATEEQVSDVNSPTISSYSQKNILIENSTITSNDIPLTMIEDTNEPVSGFVVSSITRTKGSKSPITVKGLKTSVSYIFKVFAKNLIGSSPPPSSGKTKKFTPKVFPCAAGPASSSPGLIQNTALTDITHKTTKATGIGSASGLPQGVTAAWSGGTITISGTPTAAGVFNYIIPITGTSCNNVNATGTITVEAACAVGTASSTPTLTLNTALTNITHTTTKATGIGSASGLPEGVTAAWSGNTITISGTPSATGIFNYSIPLTGTTCNNVIAMGTITVIPVSACPTTTVTYNGYDYKTVGIGTQCWMAENLRTRKYNDGTDIPFDKSENAPGTVKGETWSAWASGAHTIYAHDSTANPSNLTSYGYLYNWYAAAGIITDGGTPSTKNICPSGWHVPTDAEWTTLLNSLGGRSVAGGKMKSTLLWNSPNTGADDSSGFSALPGGIRVKEGFGSIKDAAVFWSATEAGDYYGFYGWSFILNNSVGYVNKTSNFFKRDGASVRCLRD